MLVRLLYASRAVDSAQPVIQGILSSARQHNHQLGVTGILVYGGGIFMQAIEGGRQVVSDLYGAIQRDPRVIEFSDAPESQGGRGATIVHLRRRSTS